MASRYIDGVQQTIHLRRVIMTLIRSAYTAEGKPAHSGNSANTLRPSVSFHSRCASSVDAGTINAAADASIEYSFATALSTDTITDTSPRNGCVQSAQSPVLLTMDFAPRTMHCETVTVTLNERTARFDTFTMHPSWMHNVAGGEECTPESSQSISERSQWSA